MPDSCAHLACTPLQHKTVLREAELGALGTCLSNSTLLIGSVDTTMARPVHVLSMQGKNLDEADSHMQKEMKVDGREAPFWGFSARPSRYSEKTPERRVPVPHLSPMMTASISVFCTRHPHCRSCQS